MSTTHPERSIPRSRRASAARSEGVSLLAAIFLLVVLSGLGTFMVQFSNAHHMLSALDTESARVYHYAQAGADYGTYQVLQAGTCESSTNLAIAAGYAVTVQCSAEGPYTDAGNPFSLYTLTATACNAPLSGACPGTPDGLTYAERRVTRKFIR